MSAEQGSLPIPQHMEYPGIWELGRSPNPELLADYLKWVVSDDERFASAVAGMQYFPPGFHGLLVAVNKRASDPTHRASLQLNFYHEDTPGDEEPHAHSRDAFSTWYAPAGTNQVLTRYQVIPDAATCFAGLPIEERTLMAMNIGDKGNGQRPIYMPTELGRALILPRSETRVASLGSQRFDSTEVHHAGFRGKGVAISAHYKGPEEIAELNTLPGFMYIKGLSEETANQLVAVRHNLAEELRADAEDVKVRLAPSTAMYPRPENVVSILERGQIAPPASNVSEQMLLGGLATAESLRNAA